jgi:hypothetical protein
VRDEVANGVAELELFLRELVIEHSCPSRIGRYLICYTHIRSTRFPRSLS